MRVELVPIDRVRPSTYNPRETDPARLELVMLSLRKLGFLLPIYADLSGEIVSGHQRHLGAQRLGATHVPVSYLPAMPLNRRKAANVVFNRATNDLQQSTTPAQMTAALQAQDLPALAAAVPDRVLTGPGFCPCLNPRLESVQALLRANAGRQGQSTYAAVVAKSLMKYGVLMPLVATPDLRVVNGLGRLLALAEKKIAKVPVVYVSAAQGALADALLNRLSMEFDIHRRYADLLRYNSFRRARRTRQELGTGFIFAVTRKSGNTFSLDQPSQRQTWLKQYGPSIVDFGAGHLTETAMLRAAGVYVTPFEPYRLGGDQEIDQAESVALARAFLKDVAAGRTWTSVFISSVLNSVPFKADREHIVALCAALCGPDTQLYACASCTEQAGWRSATGTEFMNERHTNCISFRLDYEPGITLGDFQDRPKVQKYHTIAEFRDLFTPHFARVEAREQANSSVATCAGVRHVDPARLRAALEFEFNLPYPNGSRMGLVSEALAAFQQRQGVTL